ncbi:hypothetical protein J4Q44_G00011160 [Coregonus suidteri]|uniref:Uncharacterized protein n=1 Tax=Coregonus suidteri TaxID=861788 RepID=A0AAN8MLX4_9TELE
MNSQLLDFDTFVPMFLQVSKGPEDFAKGQCVFDKEGNGTFMGAELHHTKTEPGRQTLRDTITNLLLSGDCLPLWHLGELRLRTVRSVNNCAAVEKPHCLHTA